jgi:hypothetical protein
MFAPHILLPSRLWSTTALRSAVTLLYPLAHSSLVLLSLSLSLSLSPHLTVPPSFVLDSSFSSCSLCVWIVCLFLLSVPSSLAATSSGFSSQLYQLVGPRNMRTTAADRSHNSSQHKQQRQEKKKSVRQLLSSSASSFCSSRIRRASPAGSKKRCAGCCPTAWWCLPACGQSCAAWPPPATSLLRPDGRPPPPNWRGNDRPRGPRGLLLEHQCWGERVSDAPEHRPGGHQGRFLGSVFFGFSRVRKGGVISVQVRGLRSVST